MPPAISFHLPFLVDRRPSLFSATTIIEFLHHYPFGGFDRFQISHEKWQHIWRAAAAHKYCATESFLTASYLFIDCEWATSPITTPKHTEQKMLTSSTSSILMNLQRCLASAILNKSSCISLSSNTTRLICNCTAVLLQHDKKNTLIQDVLSLYSAGHRFLQRSCTSLRLG